jgi:hypothetical protein
MWKIPPHLMCRQHLLGEHVEMHMFRSNLVRGRSLAGYLAKGLVEIHNLKTRHDELAAEMKARGYSHQSPFQKLQLPKAGRVNTRANFKELERRCPECRKRIRANPARKRKSDR